MHSRLTRLNLPNSVQLRLEPSPARRSVLSAKSALQHPSICYVACTLHFRGAVCHTQHQTIAMTCNLLTAGFG